LVESFAFRSTQLTMMTNMLQSWAIPNLYPASCNEETKWYALLTRARHERVVARRLEEIGLTAFLPLVTEVRRWSDRRKKVEFPLFSCYVFAKLGPTNHSRLQALRIEGVLNMVGPRGEGTPIPEEQIDAVRKVLHERLPCQSHPFLRIGQRVRVRSGALQGVEGILTARSGQSSIVVSIDAIQRSLAIRIEGYEVEPA
jgi:transcription termination/antitermination protein NusG